jgi:hypothetical protein
MTRNSKFDFRIRIHIYIYILIQSIFSATFFFYSIHDVTLIENVRYIFITIVYFYIWCVDFGSTRLRLFYEK